MRARRLWAGCGQRGAPCAGGPRQNDWLCPVDTCRNKKLRLEGVLQPVPGVPCDQQVGSRPGRCCESAVPADASSA